ncbi:PfkB family carbohydrate kinase [Botrimarina hoheduenensis]|uniref:PfkB family carbohydrate kinase n=1 Tax=Botrimarina hoheduenensis TaxID=2528000 RepID=A0A5C5VW49_9BACT|nr:PfkB family carbohydrate kinase [Botrimarina hoheduenensis]TWT42906.1 pfkB family carbohydrate kinase [Botrimarina hoheduenensis]
MDREQLARKIESRADELSQQRVVTGFDGFVDEMLSVVQTRHGEANYERVATIEHFGSLISAAAGHSSLREAVVTSVEPGGCAVNMGDGLTALGIGVETFATLGDPIHAAFAKYGQQARLHSWGDSPGRTLAFEFDDGKLMFSHVSQLASFTAQEVGRRLGEGEYQRACQAASLIALTDWTLYPHMTQVWRLLAVEVFAKLTQRKALLIDLVDPSSRSEADVRDMLAVLPELNAQLRVTLGLNQNEANVLSRLVGIATVAPADPLASAAQAAALRLAVGVEEVVLHASRFAVAADSSGTTALNGPYTSTPIKSTGAGDRFNAGYAAGLLLELGPAERLAFGVAASGVFVRTGQSAELRQVTALLRNFESWSP